MSSVAAQAGGGLAGDRTRSVQRQVTLLALEDWTAALREIGVDAPPEGRRANLLVSGVPLGTTIGKRLRVGEIVLRIEGETTPCTRMDEVSPGLRQALEPACRGGVYGCIEVGGVVRVGDRVEPAE